MYIFYSFYLLQSYNPSFLICLCFNMVSFRGQKKLGPRPDRSPLGVQFKISDEHPHPFHMRSSTSPPPSGLIGSRCCILTGILEFWGTHITYGTVSHHNWHSEFFKLCSVAFRSQDSFASCLSQFSTSACSGVRRESRNVTALVAFQCGYCYLTKNK